MGLKNVHPPRAAEVAAASAPDAVEFNALRMSRTAAASVKHLRTELEQHFEISSACKKSMPPKSQSVHAGVMGWVLEQGESACNWGQQLVVHGAARRTVD